MQIAATWCERAGFAHSRATCQRTQIYGEYTGGTIIIRLMHSSRGAHNLKLVAQVAILHCESSSLYRRNSVILCVHSSFSFFLSVCVCVLSIGNVFPIRLAKLWFHRGKNDKTFFHFGGGFVNFFFLDAYSMDSFWEEVKGIRRRDDRFWFESKSSENKWIIL